MSTLKYIYNAYEYTQIQIEQPSMRIHLNSITFTFHVRIYTKLSIHVYELFELIENQIKASAQLGQDNVCYFFQKQNSSCLSYLKMKKIPNFFCDILSIGQKLSSCVK